MLLRLTALALAVLVLPVATGCGDDDGPPADDAGVDAGRDLGRDLGTDGGASDLGSDAGDIDGGPNDPEWVPLPDLPLGCRVERALHPERLFAPRWGSCGEGCVFLEQDPEHELRPTHLGGSDRRSEDGESFVFTVLGRRGESRDTRREIVAVVGSNGSVPLAYRQPNAREPGICAIGGADYSDGWVGFSLWMRGEEADDEYDAIFHGALETMKDIERPVLLVGPDDLPGDGNLLQQAYVSRDAVAFQVQPLGEVWIVQDGMFRRLGGSGSAVPGSPQGVALVGDHALWNEWRTDVRIAHGSFDQMAEPYFGVDGARLIFATDGVDLAWVQGYGWDGARGFDRMELWTASYTREPEDLVPRRVLESYTSSTLGVVGAGTWVARMETKVLELVTLATGERSSLALDDPRANLLRQPVWVTEAEVGISGRWDGEPTLFRLSLDRAQPLD